MRATRRAALALTTLALAAAPVFAQDSFPSKPIKIIVPYPAGGLSDFQVRAISDPLSKLLGQPVIVENKAGASGAIGTQAAANAAPDGHTMVFVNNGFVIAPHLNTQVGYDPLKDLVGVTTVTTSPMVLVVHPSVPANSVAEYIAYAKSQPKGVEYGSAGAASFGHMATVQFSQATGLNMVHVPYKGEAPMTLALRTGEVKSLITTPSPSMMGFVKEGKLKLLGVASKRPAPLLPDVKQISDTVPGYSAEVWFGLLAPAGTPQRVVDKLHESVDKVLQMPDIKEKFAGVGALATSTEPRVFNRNLKAEYEQWGEVVKKAGIKPQQ